MSSGKKLYSLPHINQMSSPSLRRQDRIDIDMSDKKLGTSPDKGSDFKPVRQEYYSEISRSRQESNPDTKNSSLERSMDSGMGDSDEATNTTAHTDHSPAIVRRMKKKTLSETPSDRHRRSSWDLATPLAASQFESIPEHRHCELPSPRPRTKPPPVERRIKRNKNLVRVQSMDARAIMGDFDLNTAYVEGIGYFHQVLKIHESSALNQLDVSNRDFILNLNGKDTIMMKQSEVVNELRFNAIRFEVIFARLDENDELYKFKKSFSIEREFLQRKSGISDCYELVPILRVKLLHESGWSARGGEGDSDADSDLETDSDEYLVIARALREIETKVYFLKHKSFYLRWMGAHVQLVDSQKFDCKDTNFHFKMRSFGGFRTRSAGGGIKVCTISPAARLDDKDMILKDMILKVTPERTEFIAGDKVDSNLREAQLPRGSLCGDLCIFEYFKIDVQNKIWALKSTKIKDQCLGVTFDDERGRHCSLIDAPNPAKNEDTHFQRELIRNLLSMALIHCNN